jgi:hypothetical protein
MCGSSNLCSECQPEVLWFIKVPLGNVVVVKLETYMTPINVLFYICCTIFYKTYLFRRYITPSSGS